MNRSHFDQIIDNYAARFVELNIGDNNEVYKWEIAAEFRPMMNVALTADDTDFPAKLAAVVFLCAFPLLKALYIERQDSPTLDLKK